MIDIVLANSFAFTYKRFPIDRRSIVIAETKLSPRPQEHESA